jgi:hypothetical protein
MAEMLLINPRRRRKSARKATRSAAQRRATAKLVAMSRRRRRSNPHPGSMKSVALNPRRRRRTMRRRSNPIALRRSTRRSNPSMRFNVAGIMSAIRNALVQGAGAVAFDVAHGQIQRFLPAMLVPVPGRVGLGDLVKAAITVFVGQALNGPTRGLSSRAATGALTVQAHQLIRSYVPSTLPLGYATPGMAVQGQARVGPNRAIVGMGRYVAPGATPLLNRYTMPGATPLLNGARMREGIAIR